MDVYGVSMHRLSILFGGSCIMTLNKIIKKVIAESERTVIDKVEQASVYEPQLANMIKKRDKKRS